MTILSKNLEDSFARQPKSAMMRHKCRFDPVNGYLRDKKVGFQVNITLRGLRERRAYIKGRCRLCKFFDACGGSLRVRADLHLGDPWAPDPACYLTDTEIGLDAEKQEELIDLAWIL